MQHPYMCIITIHIRYEAINEAINAIAAAAHVLSLSLLRALFFLMRRAMFNNNITAAVWASPISDLRAVATCGKR